MSYRTAVLALGIVFGLTLAASAAGPEKAAESMAYTPPVLPEPPSAGPLLLRLVLASAVVLVIGGAACWAVRRLATRTAVGRSDSRLRLVETLPLGNGSCLYLLDCCGKRFVAGVSRTGLRSLAPLPEPFENELDVLASLS
jgi:flagellar biogenesis protein FliO